MIVFLSGILVGLAIGFMIPRRHPNKCPDCGDYIDDEGYCNTCAEAACAEWQRTHMDPTFGANE